MSDIPDDSWIEAVAHELAQEAGLPLAEARRQAWAAEERALARGQVIDVVDEHGRRKRWAVRPSSLRLAVAEGDELTAARLRRALARLQREGKEHG
jgi:hypothetical protein